MRDAIPVTLRVTLVGPPADVQFGVQQGRYGVLAAARATGETLSLDFPGEFRPGKEGEPVLYGPHAQGPPAERFVYVNAGTYSGDSVSCWGRRAKIPTRGVTWELLERARQTPGAVIEARIAGKARDGGPACATVPLLEPGWQVRFPGAG